MSPLMDTTPLRLITQFLSYEPKNQSNKKSFISSRSVLDFFELLGHFF